MVYKIYDTRTHRVAKGNAGTSRPAAVKMANAWNRNVQYPRYKVVK